MTKHVMKKRLCFHFKFIHFKLCFLSKVTHRKLAARNILLDFNLRPKIMGFGPVPDELSEDSQKKVESSQYY